MSNQAPIELSAEQKHVLNVVDSGCSVFITGPGGTGKSTVIAAIQERLALKGRKYFLTAPTGIAALNIGGSTLHSFSGAGLAQGTKEQCLKDVMVRKKNVGWWQSCQVLIVDEVSMLDPEFFEKLDFIAREIRKSNAFFGGIQLVAVGDFYQLPPVHKFDRDQKKERMEFVFEHPLWKANMKKFIVLTQVHRQKDLEFVHLLSEIRHGQLSEPGRKMLQSRVDAKIPCPDGILPTRLFATRAEADKANKDELAALPGEEHKFTRKQSSVGVMSAAQRQYLYKKLDDNCQADVELKLKEGAQVLLLVNLAVDEGLVNGSRGVVVRFDEETEWPVVRFANDMLMLIRPFAWTEIAPDRKWQVSSSQVPLKLAYGITIHKSQSLTIDLLSICLSRVFEFGQIYVALSRARTLAGLRLEGEFDPANMAPHPKVVAYYDSLGAPALDEPARRRAEEPVVSIKRGKKTIVSSARTDRILSTIIKIPKAVLEKAKPKEEEIEKRAGPECVVCMDKPSTHLLAPCGHKCVCVGCSDLLHDCPICRKTIENIIRVFE